MQPEELENSEVVWPRAEPLASARLRLEPLSAEHAITMVDVLSDPALYGYTGGEAPTLEQLQQRYAAQVAGQSADGSQGWFNWILIRSDADGPIGYVQATLDHAGPRTVAAVAWLVSPGHQGQGLASEAAQAMAGWLRSKGVDTLVAHVHPAHHASMAVARNVGLQPTGSVEDGEIRWES